MWTQGLFRGRTGALRLLNAEQEFSVWEDVIGIREDSPLLDVPATASAASTAWKLAQEYRLPIQSGSFRAQGDSEAFLRWANEFRQLVRDNGWLEGARLPALAARLAADRAVDLPARIYHTGFDALTPQQAEFLGDVARASSLPAPGYDGDTRQMSAETPEAEFEAAAHWARRILDRNPDAGIGIVVPELDRCAPALDRALCRALHPRPFFAGVRAWHVSLGSALAERPVVNAALLLLELVVERLDVRQAGVLLRSPFLEGAAPESGPRAACDAALRRKPSVDVSLSALSAAAAPCPVLGGKLRSVERRWAEVSSARRLPSAWAGEFEKLLSLTGWGKGVAAGSADHQAAEAWTKLLELFGTLDLTLHELTAAQAWERLSRMARTKRFQPEDPGAPVQVMDPAEAAGLEFDHLWVMGLDDRSFPALPQPNPFLPLSLQRDAGLPHSSAAQELKFAQMVLDRLKRSSPNVTLSYARREQDEERRPSPLLGGDWTALERREETVVPAKLEALRDDRAPALVSTGEQRGGAALLKDMAACPFRAFAIHRLGARELEEPEAGISPTLRGNAVHNALELFWNEARTRDTLIEWLADETALLQRLEANVRHALAALAAHPLYEVEVRRTKKLLASWLRVESERPPFTAAGVEQRRLIEIGGLSLKVRADRIDRLEDGREVLLDYKTGEVDKASWAGDRPEEPQLPLYCVAHEGELAAVAFAQLRAGKLKFVGAVEGTVLPELETIGLEEATLERQKQMWGERLERLAQRFVSGVAAADPLPDACKHCGLPSLCRIAGTGAATLDEEAADAAG